LKQVLFLIARNNEFYQNLKLSMYWNRDDVAKEYIFTGEEEFNDKELETLMEIALLENKPKFVEMLLENGLSLKDFLTSSRLISFYNLHEV
jgi:transient receptor potential cation channel subfamily M protein 3